MTRAWPFSFAEKNSYKESSETSKLFNRKKSTVCVDRYTSGLRVTASHPHYSLNYFYGTFLPDFLWPVILICLVHSPYLVNLKILPYVCRHLLAKWILLKRRLGRAFLGITPPLTSQKPLCTYVVGEVSSLWEWEICGLGRGQPSPLFVLLFLPWSFSPQGMNLKSFYPGGVPIYLLPQNDYK